MLEQIVAWSERTGFVYVFMKNLISENFVLSAEVPSP